MKVLIIEDEIPAYKKLLDSLNSYYGYEIEHNWSRSNADARALLSNTKYNYILSDIQLLDGISFDLFDSIQVDCPIIFCSAHDDYLFKAFSTNGIAYILKPYSKNAFDDAIKKYENLFQQGKYGQLNHNILSNLKSALTEETMVFKKRFVIKKNKGIQLLNTEDIVMVEASGDFCLAFDPKGKKHIISDTLGAIYKQLNPIKFFKINRSQIVSIDHIENIENHFKNRLLISLSGVKDKVMTSTAITSEFRKWLEG
ncbi:LytR/AlgR family response regulator transcription factor [Seonamhaeicola marinus]|uniref:Response regulator transcription factor n=1 Tax=Seonamhaeicola marinus TaxID=1912246 RepID=A0A5D0HS99_9FLAO|nr:LytTR family DNA-binding domain-containing protein [Seonamhaeicola marinus]TYA74216.1 response regulator transcription factor [Seonamhaeicola marinus]